MQPFDQYTFRENSLDEMFTDTKELKNIIRILNQF